MNLTEPKKAPLRNKDIKFRRQMLSMHSRGASKEGMGVHQKRVLGWISNCRHLEAVWSRTRLSTGELSLV
ncbi:diaphanous-related formin [Elysia marginata]|uniref:Diaphanous-related formin n=1 Tax=Elysia marginata TaxID=1093978 RepID=A0AAV4HGS5_9GAST|nr:diaphanous-related formin [Elysia marginata]